MYTKLKLQQYEPITLPAVGTLTEAQILVFARKLLTVKRWYVVRIHQSLGSMPGIADLVAMKDGRVVWIEVKSQRRSRWSPAQQEFAAEVRRQGCEYILLRDPDAVYEIDGGAVTSGEVVRAVMGKDGHE